MEEKDVIELSHEIVESLTKLVLGDEPGLFSGKVFKSLPEHPKLNQIKDLYVQHLTSFKGKYSSADDLKSLSDFRFQLVSLYNSK